MLQEERMVSFVYIILMIPISGQSLTAIWRLSTKFVHCLWYKYFSLVLMESFLFSNGGSLVYSCFQEPGMQPFSSAKNPINDRSRGKQQNMKMDWHVACGVHISSLVSSVSTPLFL